MRSSRSPTDYIRLRGPLEQPVPIHLGVTLPGMAGLAGEIADGVKFNVLTTARQIRDVLLPAIEAGARRAGRSLDDVERGVVVSTAVSNDRGAGRSVGQTPDRVLRRCRKLLRADVA